MLHMQGEAKKRTQEEDLKRRRRDEECPEEVAELQVWDGTNLLDDGVQSVNAALRTKLRGPLWRSGNLVPRGFPDREGHPGPGECGAHPPPPWK